MKDNKTFLKAVSTGHKQCVHCGSSLIRTKSYRNRKVEDLSLGGRRCFIDIRYRQNHCQKCNKYFIDHLPVRSKQRRTIRFEKSLFEEAKTLSFQQVCYRHEIHWHGVERIFFAYGSKKPDYSEVSRFGIDEISQLKGRGDFVCVVMDLDTQRLVDVLEFRDKKSLIGHFKSLGEDWCSKVEYVSFDMWSGYRTMMKACFPNAKGVVDRFHLQGALSDKLDLYRKILKRQNPEDSALLGKAKWSLFQRPEKLSAKQKTILFELFKSRQELGQVYLMLQKFRGILDRNDDSQTASKELDVWVEEAKKIRNQHLDKFIKTLGRWWDETLNYVDTKLSNGVVEGINNKIKTIKRNSYGFRSFELFKLKLLNLEFL